MPAHNIRTSSFIASRVIDETSTNVKVSESFKRKILAKLLSDKIGKYCLKDDPILLIGKKNIPKAF